ncbi:MAG: TetR/AcrR family transcriptional regulator [Spirochaetes bacterium]|nr:TetR/AcrR family transcriptional regulator [Spirochaetota bacterium]
MASGTTDRKARSGEIIRAAQEAFSRHGFKKTTIEEIAHRLGMVKSALYYYYPNKQELFLAVVEREVVQFFENIRSLIDAGHTAEEKLKIYSRQSNKFHRDFDNLYNLTADDIIQNYDGLVSMRNKFFGENVALIASILESGRRAAIMKDPRQAARLFLFSLSGIFQNYKLEKKPVPDRMLSSFVTIFIRGLSR